MDSQEQSDKTAAVTAKLYENVVTLLVKTTLKYQECDKSVTTYFNASY